MINKEYRKSALIQYGESCELCGHRTSLEVHHINYQEQQEIERKIREADRKALAIGGLIEIAKSMGFDEYKNGQLSKDDNTKNLSVLCGNCHSFVHLIDMGLKLLRALKPRR